MRRHVIVVAALLMIGLGGVISTIPFRAGAQIPPPPTPPSFDTSTPPATLQLFTTTPAVAATSAQTPTATASATPTATKTSTVTATPKPTATATRRPTPTATRRPTPTPTRRPTPTATRRPTLPPGSGLLAASLAVSRKRGSVHWTGAFLGSDRSPVTNLSFVDDFSWTQRKARIIEHFPYGSTLGRSVKDLKYRVTVRHEAVHYRGSWHCTRPNSAFWAAPAAPKLQRVVILGVTKIDRRVVEIIRGKYVSRQGKTTSRFTVTVFVDRSTHLLRRLIQAGTERTPGRPTIHVASTFNYTKWGEAVTVRIPFKCQRT